MELNFRQFLLLGRSCDCQAETGSWSPNTLEAKAGRGLEPRNWRSAVNPKGPDPACVVVHTSNPSILEAEMN